MKKISVIIPVYNIEKYLEKCLTSIESQTVFQELEIILIDDGSTDNSSNICDRFKEKYTSTIVVHQKNEGVSNARNKGIEIASSEYISFVDGDDYLDPNHYEEMLKDIKKEYDLIIHDYYVKFEKDKYKYRNKTIDKEFEKKAAIKELLSGGCIGNNLFDKLFKKEKLKDLKFDVDIKIGEDLYFIFLFLMNASKILCRPIATYNYIQRAGSAMNSSFNEKYFDIITISKRISKIINDFIPDLSGYSESLYIYSIYKTLERAYKSNAFEKYSERLLPLKETIKKYSIFKAYKYMSSKKLMGLILMKLSPKFYLLVCRIKKI